MQGRKPDAGLSNILARVKTELKRRGASGIIGIGRKFRIMDDDGSKSLDMGEFKKAMKECELGLNDMELRVLFNHFDVNGDGTVDYEEFLVSCRDPMNDRRLGLTRLAFSSLDVDGNGTIEPEDIVDAYDASKHPEVIAGRKTADEVFREFLDTFDVGGEKDGRVTMQEWINYYNNVSASIDDDDYFELMMRNAWHISGGGGQAANSSNRRVLVTHADGHQTVEEVKDDLGVKASDSGEITRRLGKQGVKAANINFFAGEENGVDSTTPTAPASVYRAATARGTGVADALGGTLPSAPASSPVSPVRPLSTSSSSGGGADAGLLSILSRLKAELKSRGAVGIIGLSRKFRIMDDDGSKSLNMGEFKKAMKECSLDLNDMELRRLFNHFDRDGNGSVEFEEFLSGVRDAMNKRREELVRIAFSRMDKDGNGTIEPEDIVDAYDASKHPDVISGRKTADEVFREFLDTFDVGGEKDGRVTMQEWLNYYQNVSNCVDDDDYFELMIRNAWHISGGVGQAANSSNRRLLVTHEGGRQTVEEVKDDLGVKASDSGEITRRLGKQGVKAAGFNLFAGGEDGVELGGVTSSATLDGTAPVLAPAPASPPAGVRTAGAKLPPPPTPCPPTPPPAPTSTAATPSGPAAAVSPTPAAPASQTIASPCFRRGTSNIGTAVASLLGGGTGGGVAVGGGGSRPPSSGRPRTATGARGQSADAGLLSILSRLKAELKSRGAVGIIGLSRKFRIMDDDGSKSLNMGEFKKAMKECSLDLNDMELRRLFNHFDRDGNGSVEFEEFLSGVRDAMNKRREELVRIAFSRMDKDGNGTIEPEDIVDAYDASKHPEVISGRKTADEVFREFLDTFDVGGEKDGRVTMQEWLNYYQNVSNCIDDDDYFELMIRNAWHISGGVGQAANSSNRRVLVTHEGGRQTVEEVKDDLGVKASDSGEITRRLGKQGVKAASINLFAGGKDGVGAENEPHSGRGRVGRNQINASSISFGVEVAKPPAASPTGAGNPASGGRADAAYSLAQRAGGERDPVVILEKLRTSFRRRGAVAIAGLGRRFRIMDDDGSRGLDVAEFSKAVCECGIRLTKGELKRVFKLFDKDGNGSIDYEELLAGIRRPMNARREALVRTAFTFMDKDGNGTIEPDDIVGAYDASRHPAVLEGRKTVEQVFREFLDTFDVGGEKDGRVTMQEWLNYYQNVSNCVDDDDYFELMIRNAWHISGGVGQAANSSNRRVLVTHEGGRQTVEEVKDDLGVKASDSGEITRRLGKQGVKAANVKLFAGGEDGVGGNGNERMNGGHSSTILNPNPAPVPRSPVPRFSSKANRSSFQLG